MTMKKLVLSALLALATAGAVSAQNYVIIHSEKVFKSIPEYTEALETVDSLGKAYQAQVDQRFAQVETLYNSYMAQKASLSATSRQQQETLILQKEREATEYQQEIFGAEGTLMKKRIELIQPIQKRVFDAIERCATQHGYDMLLDASNNATLLYNSGSIDHTQQIIDALK